MRSYLSSLGRHSREIGVTQRRLWSLASLSNGVAGYHRNPILAKDNNHAWIKKILKMKITEILKNKNKMYYVGCRPLYAPRCQKICLWLPSWNSNGVLYGLHNWCYLYSSSHPGARQSANPPNHTPLPHWLPSPRAGGGGKRARISALILGWLTGRPSLDVGSETFSPESASSSSIFWNWQK